MRMRSAAEAIVDALGLCPSNQLSSLTLSIPPSRVLLLTTLASPRFLISVPTFLASSSSTTFDLLSWDAAALAEKCRAGVVAAAAAVLLAAEAAGLERAAALGIMSGGS